MSDPSTKSAKVSAEERIAKQCRLLAKRLLKSDGDESVGLVVDLLMRAAQSSHLDKNQQTRAVYAFLLKNGIDEDVAWNTAGMGLAAA